MAGPASYARLSLPDGHAALEEGVTDGTAPCAPRARAARWTSVALAVAAGLVATAAAARAARAPAPLGRAAQLAAPRDPAAEECHTAVAGETCFGEVTYQRSNLADHPEWFPDLTADASFEEVQRALYEQSRCPLPCAAAREAKDEKPKGEKVEADEEEPGEAEGKEEEEPSEQKKVLHVVKRGEGAREQRVGKGPKEERPEADADLDIEEKEAAGHDHDLEIERQEAAGHGRGGGSAAHGPKRRGRGSPKRAPVARPAGAHHAAEAADAELATAADVDDSEGCRRPADDSKCGEGVLWVQSDGIFAKPEWYKGIHVMSSFEEVQGLLRQSSDEDHLCPKPCACHTAKRNEHCYDKVMWILKDGLVTHPDWFQGLTLRSRFEEVQDFVHGQNKSECPRPCTPRRWGTPDGESVHSLYCYSVIRTDNYEFELMKEQLRKNAGIFGCDEFTVFSTDEVELGVGGVRTVSFQPAPVGTSKDGTAGNAELFMHVWDAVKEEARYRMHDWAIKTDPDAVLLPARLREHVRGESGAVYVKNCAASGTAQMYGSVEAISREAMDLYYQGEERCRNELPWQIYGEDLFMKECLDRLGARGATDLGLVGDGVCTGYNCGDGSSAAYHPFKDMDSWFSCWRQAIA